MTAPLDEWQLDYNGFTMGAGTDYEDLEVNGLYPDNKLEDVDILVKDGAWAYGSGLRKPLHIVITGTYSTEDGDAETAFEAVHTRFATAFAPRSAPAKLRLNWPGLGEKYLLCVPERAPAFPTGQVMSMGGPVPFQVALYAADPTMHTDVTEEPPPPPADPFVLVDAATATGTDHEFDLTLPEGIADGDVLIVDVWGGDGSSPLGPDNLDPDRAWPVVRGDGDAQYLLARVYAAAGAPFHFSFPEAWVTVRWITAAVALRPADPWNPDDNQWRTVAANESVILPGVGGGLGAGAGDLLAFFSQFNDAGSDLTVPPDMDLLADQVDDDLFGRVVVARRYISDVSGGTDAEPAVPGADAAGCVGLLLWE